MELGNYKKRGGEGLKHGREVIKVWMSELFTRVQCSDRAAAMKDDEKLSPVVTTCWTHYYPSINLFCAYYGRKHKLNPRLANLCQVCPLINREKMVYFNFVLYAERTALSWAPPACSAPYQIPGKLAGYTGWWICEKISVILARLCKEIIRLLDPDIALDIVEIYFDIIKRIFPRYRLKWVGMRRFCAVCFSSSQKERRGCKKRNDGFHDWNAAMRVINTN